MATTCPFNLNALFDCTTIQNKQPGGLTGDVYVLDVQTFKKYYNTPTGFVLGSSTATPPTPDGQIVSFGTDITPANVDLYKIQTLKENGIVIDNGWGAVEGQKDTYKPKISLKIPYPSALLVDKLNRADLSRSVLLIPTLNPDIPVLVFGYSIGLRGTAQKYNPSDIAVGNYYLIDWTIDTVIGENLPFLMLGLTATPAGNNYTYTLAQLDQLVPTT